MYDDIFLFVRLVETGSFSALSRKIDVTQTTISRRIRTLEDKLGVTLFHRNTRKLEPNETGKTLYHKFKHQERSLQIHLEDIINTEDNLCGTLKVALPMAISKTVIAPHISDFSCQHPKLNLIISFITSQIDLVRDGFDLAVSLAMPRSQNSVIKILHNFKIHFYATREYLDKNPPINTIDDFLTHKKLGYIAPDGTLVRQLIATNNVTGEERIINLEPTLFVNNVVHAYEIAQSDNILIAGWDSLIAPALQSGEIIKVLPDYTFGVLPCYLIKESAEVPRVHKTFIQFIEKCFANVP